MVPSGLTSTRPSSVRMMRPWLGWLSSTPVSTTVLSPTCRMIRMRCPTAASSTELVPIRLYW